MEIDFMGKVEKIDRAVNDFAHDMEEVMRKLNHASDTISVIVDTFKAYNRDVYVHLNAVESFLASEDGTINELIQVHTRLGVDISDFEKVHRNFEEFVDKLPHEHEASSIIHMLGGGYFRSELTKLSDSIARAKRIEKKYSKLGK